MAGQSSEIKNFSRLPDACVTGGWKYTDEEQIRLQRGVVWDLIKQLGQNLTQGQSLINISMPVRIFEPRSYLQRIADGWCFAPIYLTKAAQETDPVERMKNLITFAVSGLSNTCVGLKPFNPILGETYQAVFEDGAQLFCEQSSHHPPVTCWQVIGPDNLYHFYGFGEWTASFRGNAVKGHQKGLHIIDFPNGGKITYNLPEAWLRGLMWGERVLEYDGLMKFRDEANLLGCDLRINPPAKGGSSWFGFGRSTPKSPTDYISGTIFRSLSGDLEDESSREHISVLEGSWMGCVLFDDRVYWDWELGLKKYDLYPCDDPLPSDCRFREDLIALSKNDYDAATEWKAKLENKQRREAKLRKDGLEKRRLAEAGLTNVSSYNETTPTSY